MQNDDLRSLQTQPKTAEHSTDTDCPRKSAAHDRENMGNGQPDCPLPDGRTTAIFPPPRTDDNRSQQPAQDLVDEIAMESFPCSDPPSFSGSHA